MQFTDTIAGPLQERERALDWLTAASPLLLIAFIYYRWQVVGLALLAAAGYAAVYALLQWAGVARVTTAPAVNTGVWIALLLSASTPIWVAAVAGMVAAAVAFLPDLAARWISRSRPLLHPVLAGYALVRWVFPAYVCVYEWPLLWAPLDAVPSVTNLAPLIHPADYPILHLLFGIREGAVGEGCILVLLLAMGYLLLRRRLRVVAPVSMVAVVAVLSWLIWDAPLQGVLVGTTVLAALLLADNACAPASWGEQTVTGVVAGGVAVLMRATIGGDGCVLGVLVACLLSPLYPPFLRLCRRAAVWLWGVMRRYIPPTAAWLWARIVALSRSFVTFLREKICKKQK